MATQQGGPGLRYGTAFAPQQTPQPIAQPAVPGQPQTEPPVLRQPYDPETGEAFKSKEDAETWIANYIAEAVRLQEAVVE
jgi:hypothetical protein